MPDFGAVLGDIGGAVSDLFGAEGSSQAGQAYGTAASIADQNAALTLRSTAIQEQQAAQQTYKALGAEQADTAGAGFNVQSGSAGDLLRASASQAALSKQLIQNQGEVTAAGYQQQAAAYRGQEQAAQTQSEGQGIGGILSIASAALAFL